MTLQGVVLHQLQIDLDPECTGDFIKEYMTHFLQWLLTAFMAIFSRSNIKPAD